MTNEKIRNVAIIAHVDHGKTSLVNEMLKQGGIYRENQVVGDRVMDSNAIEKERGITILAKNASCYYKDIKINVVDTPGHADFGGEVERVLKMVDGVLLVVDAFEGPMPQTRFVLEKALAQGLKVVIVINKIDRPDARLNDVGDEVLMLLLELDATSEQLNSPIVYCSARQGVASMSPSKVGENLIPLFEAIVNHIDPPKGDEKGPLQMLVSSAEQNDFVGKLAIGKVTRGSMAVGQSIVAKNFFDDANIRGRIAKIFEFDGLKRAPVESAQIGDIVCVAGIDEIKIGDTICDASCVEAVPFVKISEPSVEMTFMVNDSPFAGKEKPTTSRVLRERLYKEAIKDLSLRVQDGETTESFRICGRGEMHLSILIENMRRDGYEFQVSMPKVMYKEINGKKCEPIERLVLDVPEASVGTVMSKMGQRKADLLQMTPHGSRMRMEFLIPSRGLFGFKSDFLTDTRGEGIISSVFHDYEPYKGDIERRTVGSLIAFETGESVAYGLFNAQERGELIIGAGVPVYGGMIIGKNPKNEDLVVNVCKKKQLSNMRSSSSDESLHLTPIKPLTLEEGIEFIADDELMEVTPKCIRIRKKILDHAQRMRQRAKN
ncbi:MAG: translational GTPase TypA [Clostridia bacterium]